MHLDPNDYYFIKPDIEKRLIHRSVDIDQVFESETVAYLVNIIVLYGSEKLSAGQTQLNLLSRKNQ